jgi:hypothetical protein
MPVGAITYAVISEADGAAATISAGIAYGIGDKEEYDLVAEAYECMDQATLMGN